MLTRSAAAGAPAEEAWRENLVENPEAAQALALAARRVAVLGIKTEAKREEPAYHVPEYLVAEGVDVVPVPVYFPDAQSILGRPVFRSVAAVPCPPPLDIVCIFRRPADVAGHVDDVLAAKPRCVWLQLGIRNDEAAEAWARAGLLVVQDRCLLVEHAQAKRASRSKI